MIAKKDIPNLLTYARVLAVPLALAIILLAPGMKFALLVIFVLASITDLLDGYLARKWNVISVRGALLDPAADKLLVAVLLLYLVDTTPLSLLPVAIILLRELYVAGLREFLALRAIPLPVSKGGKWKTALQMIAISFLLAGLAFEGAIFWHGGEAMLWLAAFLALISGIHYTRIALPHLK